MSRISTHTPLAGRDENILLVFLAVDISTHTPLAGRDVVAERRPWAGSDFYSHAPCGARLRQSVFINSHFKFLLTRPLRGATPSTARSTRTRSFLLTRPLRGATVAPVVVCFAKQISTHTPLAGRDSIKRKHKSFSTISTHTPLAGRDCRTNGTGL